jgi:hypothetical protein
MPDWAGWKRGVRGFVIKVPVIKAAVPYGIAAAGLLSLTVACTGAGPAGASSPRDAASGVSAAAATRPVVFNYAEGWQHGRVEPHAIYIGNGGAPYVTRLVWSHWNGTSAYASGILDRQYASCLRVKAAYKCPEHRFGVGVTLSRVESHDGVRYFSRMRWSWHTRSGAHRFTYWRTARGFWN